MGGVSITGSNINLNGGNFTAVGIATTAGLPGVGIWATSSITTTGSGNITIQGTGLLLPSPQEVGVLISGSTVALTGAGTGGISIRGYSDAGFTGLTPNSVFADDSFGVQVTNSNIASSSAGGLTIHGTAYAANNLDSIGVDLSGNSVIGTTNSG